MTRYAVELSFGKFEIEAELGNAGATIYNITEGEEVPTQWQTADAQHCAAEAMKLALSTCGREWFARDDDDRDDGVILDELLEGESITVVGSITEEAAVERIRYFEYDDDDDGPEDLDEARDIFIAVFGREPEDDVSKSDLWSQACAAVN